MSGIFTNYFANKLAKNFYDHKIICGHRVKDSNPCTSLIFKKVQLSINEQKSKGTIISEADIAICKDGKILAIIEVEEINTTSPKKLFSDIMSFILVQQVFINAENVSITDKTVFIIIGLHNSIGSTEEKVKKLIKILSERFETEYLLERLTKIKVKTYKNHLESEEIIFDWICKEINLKRKLKTTRIES